MPCEIKELVVNTTINAGEGEDIIEAKTVLGSNVKINLEENSTAKDIVDFLITTGGEFEVIGFAKNDRIKNSFLDKSEHNLKIVKNFVDERNWIDFLASLHYRRSDRVSSSRVPGCLDLSDSHTSLS